MVNSTIILHYILQRIFSFVIKRSLLLKLISKKLSFTIYHLINFFDIKFHVFDIIATFNSAISVDSLSDCSSTKSYNCLDFLQPVTGTFLHPTNSLVNLNTTNHVKLRQQKSPELPGLMHYIDYYICQQHFLIFKFLLLNLANKNSVLKQCIVNIMS